MEEEEDKELVALLMDVVETVVGKGVVGGDGAGGPGENQPSHTGCS